MVMTKLVMMAGVSNSLSWSLDNRLFFTVKNKIMFLNGKLKWPRKSMKV